MLMFYLIKICEKKDHHHHHGHHHHLLHTVQKRIMHRVKTIMQNTVCTAIIIIIEGRLKRATKRIPHAFFWLNSYK